MREFYHVSRADISTVKYFELKMTKNAIDLEGYYSSEEFINKKHNLFPKGISKFGEQYLHEYYYPENQNNEFIIESVFELIRRLKYPNLKSRFQSTFGCLTIEDAKKIKEITFKGEGNIYKVACDSYFIADMNLLNQARSIIGIEIIANKYWSGIYSKNPTIEVLMNYPVEIIEKIEI